MRNILAAFAASTALLQSAAFAQAADQSGAAATAPATAAKPLTTCAALALDWRNVEIDLARSDIEEIGDDSAPRATMRAMRDGNSLQKAAITLSLMRDNKCPLPKRAPSSTSFMIPALDCRTEQLKGNYKAPQCDTATWKRIGE